MELDAQCCLIALKEQFLVIHELHFFFHNSSQNNTIPLSPLLVHETYVISVSQELHLFLHYPQSKIKKGGMEKKRGTEGTTTNVWCVAHKKAYISYKFRV